MSERLTLVGDSIENPGNADTMIAAAAMFDGHCAFHDPRALLETSPYYLKLSHSEIASDFAPIVALDNVPGAESIHGFRAPPGPRPALVVGNERHGISRELLALSQRKVLIPLASKRLNTINVAAASAIALSYISHGGGAKLRTRSDPERTRPELLLLGPTDAIEVGSAIRSVAAFGWSRVLVEDRRGVWFDSDRVTRSLGRGAARRGRNSIHVVPVTEERRHSFEEACIVTALGEGEPLHRVDLARGPEQLIVIADEGGVALGQEDLGRLAREVRVVGLDLPRRDFAYHYRLIASIVVAEVARQVGVRERPGQGRMRPPVYDRALRSIAEDSVGVCVSLAELPL